MPGRQLRASRNLVQSLGQLDVGAPRILDEGDGDAERVNFGIRALQLDALCLQLLAELLEVLHFEADVIDRAALRPDDWLCRRREIQRHSRQGARRERDRKSTRLNSSHSSISYAVFCLKKKKK